MDAKVSETMTGFKSLLLKMADPIFRKNGRTVIPLRIGGTRNDPQFGLDMGRVFRRRDTPPPAAGTRMHPGPSPKAVPPPPPPPPRPSAPTAH